MGTLQAMQRSRRWGSWPCDCGWRKAAFAMTAPDKDVFDRVARLVRDRELSLGIPYPRDATPKEQQEKVETARKAHLDALAHFMREGGEAQEFFKATFHLHGGNSTNLLPLDLALKFRSVGTLTAEECWAFVMCWRRSPGERWPGNKSASARQTPANRQLDHNAIIQEAAELLAAQPTLSKGAAAASIVAELPHNPRTGKPRDTRHIERIIAHLWDRRLSEAPL